MITLNDEQTSAIDAIRDFVESDEPFFGLYGYAGTGKTTVIQHVFADRNGRRVAMTAPTHKATGVLARVAASQGLSGVSFATIHSLLGCTKIREDGDISFRPNPSKEQPIRDYEVVIVDECSMVGKEMWGWIRDAIRGRDTKVIFMGDPAQLPPVGENASPTFDIPHVTLSTIVRNHGCIQAAGTRIREHIMDVVPPIAFDAEDEHGCIANLEQESFCAKMLEHADADSKVLAFTNEAVDWLNDFIRAEKFGVDAEPFVPGERLVCAETIEVNYKTTLHTETELKVLGATRTTRLGLDCWRLSVADDTGSVVDIHALDDAQRPPFLRALGQAKAKGRALGGSAWSDFYTLQEAFARVRPGWATTIHKSQGSTYDKTFLVQTNVLRSAGRDHAFRNMLLYVGYSRAKKGLFLS